MYIFKFLSIPVQKVPTDFINFQDTFKSPKTRPTKND